MKKRQKRNREDDDLADKNVIAQFVSSDGQKTGAPLDIPLSFTDITLQELLNELLSNEEPLPYSFFVNGDEIVSDLKSFVKDKKVSIEQTVQIEYQPQAVFRVRPLTRCTSTLPGHTDSVLCVSFSPDGSMLASGSGDKTVRLWDLHTQTPSAVCEGHTHWVLCLAWAPDLSSLASGSHDGTVRIWDWRQATTDDAPLSARHVFSGHKQWVTALSWEPLHEGPCRRLVSAGKDGTARVWDTKTGRSIQTLSGHTAAVTCVKWGAERCVYTASQDRTIMVWRQEETTSAEGNGLFVVLRVLRQHGHWVNHLALSTDHVTRTGPFDHTHAGSSSLEPVDDQDAVAKAKTKMEAHRRLHGRERLVSCSDDFTMILWDATDNGRPLARMTGHQQLVNSVAFSPDGAHIASGSFDKSVRLWNGKTGAFVATLRGHVGAVYSVVFSADSRMLLSASKDSTVKLWNLRTRRLAEDLPGHEDEVYAVDWDPLGACAASGGKDRALKIWRGAN